MWSARVCETRNCPQVGKNARDWTQWFPSALSLCELHIFVRKSQIFKTLVEKPNKHQTRPLGYHRKVSKCRCLKCSHIVHLDLKCMNYDKKKRLGVKLRIWFPSTNCLRARSNDFRLRRVIHRWKDFFKGYKILPLHVQNKPYLRKIWMCKISKQQKSQFWDSHLKSWEKMSFECDPCVKSQNIL